jgi:hypothetical protein
LPVLNLLEELVEDNPVKLVILKVALDSSNQTIQCEHGVNGNTSGFHPEVPSSTLGVRSSFG